MRHSASRSLFFVAFGACAWLALRPAPAVERVFDVALAPTRVLGELCAPLTWLRSRRVHAAESALEDSKDLEYEQRRELHAKERRAAEPAAPELRTGRRFIHAEVQDHLSTAFDRVSVRVDGDDCSGIARGMPVTVGDVFIGRIVDVDLPTAGHAIVELATAGTFAVGATLTGADGARLHCVVGGMSAKPRKNEALLLSVSIPDRRVQPVGVARVDESLSVLARFAEQSDGFELGQVEALAADRWAVRPQVDFRTGLFQVVIVVADTIERSADVEPPDELADGAWFVAHATSAGEPNAGREGLELAVGRWNGARDGAALVVGARLIGRIEHAGALTSDARLLGDVGFAVHVLAELEDRDAPVVLGRLVSRGRARDAGAADEIVFEWNAVVPIAAQGSARSVHALLFTGSGDAGIPRGLLLGECDLPFGGGTHLLHVRQTVDTRDVRHVYVRRLDAEGSP